MMIGCSVLDLEVSEVSKLNLSFGIKGKSLVTT